MSAYAELLVASVVLLVRGTVVACVLELMIFDGVNVFCCLDALFLALEMPWKDEVDPWDFLNLDWLESLSGEFLALNG